MLTAFDQVLLPELLKSVGYKTALVGKLHLIPDREAHPTGHPKVGHGLDHFYGFVGGMTGYWERSASWQRNGERFSEKGYTTHLITKEAVAVVNAHPLHRHNSRTVVSAALPTHVPLFLWVAWTAPHRPMEATPEEEALYPEETLHPKVRTYAAMVMAAGVRGVRHTHAPAGLSLPRACASRPQSATRMRQRASDLSAPPRPSSQGRSPPRVSRCAHIHAHTRR